MKSFEFDESQLSEFDEIVLKLFEDENDPRSTSYKRTIVRPKINWFVFVAWILCPIICILVLRYGLLSFGIKFEHCWIIVLGVLFYLFCTAKWLVVFLINVYQRYAPTEVRMKCRFEPSCSEYMLTAIRKYGLFKGVNRGLNRLKRCNVNGGGFDEP